MAHGLPVVVTTIAAEGMDLSDGETALIADSAGEFADAVVRLFKDQQLYQRLSSNGRHVARARWSEEVAARGLLALMKTLPGIQPKRASGRKRLLWTARVLLRKAGVATLWRGLRKAMKE